MKKGWIKNIRKSKGLIFLVTLCDGKEIQVTLTENSLVKGELKNGASFICYGRDSITPTGQYEFLGEKLEITGKSDDSYPLQPKKHTMEYLRTIPEFRGRTKTLNRSLQLRHWLSYYLEQYLIENEFFKYTTPIVTEFDCEGAGQTFSIKSDWIDSKLTVSGQLHAEIGMYSLGKVYTFSPCFRAEKSTTRKHLSEFWMLEPEMAYYDLFETMKLVEDLIKSAVLKVDGKLKLSDTILDIFKKEWLVLDYSDICKEFDISFGEDISSDIEHKIVEKYQTACFITNYAKSLKPFYMKNDGEIAKCFDLLFPIVGELVGGSEREDDYDILYAKIKENGIDITSFEPYLNTRKYGSVPHAGFGLGFDRLLMYISEIDNIKDVVPFPISY